MRQFTRKISSFFSAALSAAGEPEAVPAPSDNSTFHLLFVVNAYFFIKTSNLDQ
jgi:hypothetical protein